MSSMAPWKELGGGKPMRDHLYQDAALWCSVGELERFALISDAEKVTTGRRTRTVERGNRAAAGGAGPTARKIGPPSTGGRLAGGRRATTVRTGAGSSSERANRVTKLRRRPYSKAFSTSTRGTVLTNTQSRITLVTAEAVCG